MPRTRAMGQSPGGFQALDMDAPIRKRKSAQTYGPDRQARKTGRAGVFEDKLAPVPTLRKDQSPSSLAERTRADAAVEGRPKPVTFANQCSPPSKRKNVDTIDEERPTKRTRLEVVRTVESVPKPQLQPLPQPEPEPEISADKAIDSSSKCLGTSSIINRVTYFLVEIIAPTLPINSVTQNTPLESSKTPPLVEAEGTQATLGGSKRTLSRNELEAKKRSQKTLKNFKNFKNLAKLARKTEPEDLEALSDYEDDDDWNRRYKRMLADLKSDAKESPSSTSLFKWSPDSKALFAVKQIVSESDNPIEPC
jgi:hypothetical protein